MEIIKSKLFRSRKCEFGDFELVPEKGWKLSQKFIDFESGLLIVSVIDEDKNNWKDLGRIRSIPSKQFVVDLEKLEILTPMSWKKYFSYEKVSFVSDDKKFRLITQRIHEPENNTDSIYEELEYLEIGHKSTSTGVAFRQEKRENSLESMYREIKEKEEQKRVLDAKPTLEKFYEQELKKLNDNDVIIGYFDENNTYKLAFENNVFNLFVGGKLPNEYGAWSSHIFNLCKTYHSMDSFWDDFSKKEKWFLKFRHHQSITEKPLILARYIISFFNNLRKDHSFTYAEYDKINDWENSVWSDEYKRTELKQWCSNCYKEVYYQARYPKYICRECTTKDKFDKNGNLVDDTRDEYEYIIDGKEYFAQEARFGGTVIQRKE
jgi:hypothetical protein